MSFTHLILTGIIALLALGVGMAIVYYVTQSYILMTVTSFVITETAFVILAMNSEGLFYWFCVIFAIPLCHFWALLTLAHGSGEDTRPTQEHDINKAPKGLRDSLK